MPFLSTLNLPLHLPLNLTYYHTPLITMIILTMVNSHNFIEINDTIPFTLQKDTKYFLRVTTGKFTIKAFIQLYFMNPNEDIYISTSNLEYFLFKTRIVKSRVCVKRGEENEREREYLKIEEGIKKKGGKGSRGSKEDRGSGGNEGKCKTPKRSRGKEPKRGTPPTSPTTNTTLTLTFSPNIFLSLKSSLISPSLYFFKETPSSLIFKECFKRRMSYEEISKIGDIKSLIFTRIIIKEGDEYRVNPLMGM
ncbi:hypothetical protein NBO_437g0002 [Nosema bombycis CQ1]|uniref:Uncharacterized protein n=1 Tax=Nosema bombycis (strain CQ1 / CVCC 102059) TaxID=578461 RepID=R0M377_NOSB1|nr:hypothetical protein NBO_437g0002 [Nosema bombycis CQ1]|eukprot:EOB12459.1 hypothetical protein NBO_437g0002 [Nosema bombycis CQ1]